MKTIPKSLLYLIVLGLLGVLSLTACAQTEPQSAVESGPAVVVEAPAAEVEQPVVEEAAVSAAPAHDPSDLSLVANTGRPQFLNVFAQW